MRKISAQCVDLWCRVLAAVPDARLVLLDAADPQVQRRLAEEFARRAITADRIEWRGRLSLGDYYEAIGAVDIALDTLPYNGGTTTFDALWMGVPLVALTGERSISRSASSILRTMGLPELVADSAEAYVALNVRLAADAAWRRTLRATLRARLEASPLMDAARFTAALEAGYRAMWAAWCSSQGRQP
jgi:predicted O-linked N-acetylglucosamine transferase (SPINDLY family)